MTPSRLAQQRAQQRAEEGRRWTEAQERLAQAIYYAVGTVRNDDRPAWTSAIHQVRARYMLAAGFCLRVDGWTEPSRV